MILEWPTTPWQRIHLDFNGPFLGRMFRIIVDAHSKWPGVEKCQPSHRRRPLTDSEPFSTDMEYQHRWWPTMTRNLHRQSSNYFWRLMVSSICYHGPIPPCNQRSSGMFFSEFQTCYEMRETKYIDIPTENQFDDWRITVRVVFEQTATDSPRFGETWFTMNRQIDQAGRKGHSPTRQLFIGQTVMARNYSGKDKWLPGIVRAQTGPPFIRDRSWSKSNLATPHRSASSLQCEIKWPEWWYGWTSSRARRDWPEYCTSRRNVAEPNIQMSNTIPPVVQQEEASRATTGSEQCYPTRSHEPPERWSLNCLIRKLPVKKTT
jgi:hypothetical protein